MSQTTALHHLEPLIRSAFEEGRCGEYYLVDLEVSPSKHIGVFVDGDEGVSLDTCTQISRILESILDLESVRVPIGLRLFHDSGLSLRVSTTYVEQSGTFSIDVTLPTFEQDDNAWITDLALDYRLPRRRGLVSVGVLNIGDNFIDLLETDPLNPRVSTRRFGFVKLRLTF